MADRSFASQLSYSTKQELNNKIAEDLLDLESLLQWLRTKEPTLKVSRSALGRYSKKFRELHYMGSSDEIRLLAELGSIELRKAEIIKHLFDLKK